MGQQTSQFEDLVSPLMEFLSEEPLNTLLSTEIHTLTYEKFILALGELNKLAKQCLDSDGKRFVFAIKKGTDSSFFWKATVKIACVRLDSANKVETFRLLTLIEFLKVFKTLQVQIKAAEQSEISGVSVSRVLDNLSKETTPRKECCICLERKQEVILPCAHSFCSKCVEDWSEIHSNCPICRETLESTDDAWVLSEVPNADEISKEIQMNLNDLVEEKENPICTTT